MKNHEPKNQNLVPGNLYCLTTKTPSLQMSVEGEIGQWFSYSNDNGPLMFLREGFYTKEESGYPASVIVPSNRLEKKCVFLLGDKVLSLPKFLTEYLQRRYK